MKREAIALKDRWNVEALYPNYEAWQKECETICQKSQSPYWPKFSSFSGRLHEGAEVLAEALNLYFEISRGLEKLHTYAHLRHDEEITLNLPKGHYQKITTLVQEFQKESSWLEPELLKIDPSQMHQFLLAEPLKEYRFYLEKILRRAPHTLSAEIEQLMASAQTSLQTPPRVFSALNNADLKFGEVSSSDQKRHPLTHGLYHLYLRSNDKTLRKNAFCQMHHRFREFENTFCELLHGQVQVHHLNSQSRHFNSSLEAALFPNNIPTGVYHTLIKTVRKHLPVLHRYVALRKKVLGVDPLPLYDMYVPLVEDVNFGFEYEKAEELVIRSVAPLGKEYQRLLKKGLQEDRWVDRFENENKRSGAYSSGCFDSHPYILMNYTKTVRDTFTLAHEAGHSMHSYLTQKKQPYPYANYPIFVAEVASTFNEELLMHLLMNEVTHEKERLFLINEKLENLRATLFRQTMFAEFELKIHELVEQKLPFTPTLLKEIYIDLNRAYFGPDALIDETISIEWARIPHFYYNFYVYQYATGISAALTLADRVLKGEKGACESYLHFLESGSTLFPIDLLKLAGVDLTTATPVENAIKIFGSLTKQLEEKLAVVGKKC